MTTAGDLVEPGSHRRLLLLRMAVFVAVLASVVTASWLCEDACITLRTVYNALDGYGLRWNTDDRVQTYTHPLWMLLLLLANGAVRSPYFATLALCWLCTAATLVVLLWGLARRPPEIVGAGVLCLLTRSWHDYATSGLENPMSHLCAVLAVLLWPMAGDSPRRLRQLGLVTGLAAWNRLDLVLLLGPMLLAAMWRHGWRERCTAGALAAAPVAGWMAFALVYYGSPFPITLYGKLATIGMPFGYLLANGFEFLGTSLARDPVLALVLAMAVGAVALQRRLWPPVLGVLLYIGYSVRVGGDYMSGRLLSAPFVLALGVVLQRGALPAVWLPALLALAIGWLPGWPRFCEVTNGDFPPPPTADSFEDQYEQQRPLTGLLAPGRIAIVPASLPPPGPAPHVTVQQAIGLYALLSGPTVHVVDPVLTDPVLMHLPNHGPRPVRRCHYLRRIPDGYLETLATGENRIADPGLAQFVADQLLVTRGPIWSAERWAAIWRLQSGRDRAALGPYLEGGYRDIRPLHLDAAALAAPVADGAPWYDPGMHVLHNPGIEVALGAARQATRLHLALDCANTYAFEFLRRSAIVGRQQVTTKLRHPLDEWRGAERTAVEVPASVGPMGFDAVRVLPRMPSFDFLWAIGDLQVDP